ncbi:MAG: hypothetical protein ACE15B_22025 [Bryobacteraceae bacterium]
MKLSRRELAALAAAASARAAERPEDELKAARESGRRTGETLAKVQIPVETEPAFLFKA